MEPIAVWYGRYSTGTQGASYGEQKAEVEQLAAGKYKLLDDEYFDYAVSGRDFNRPQFIRLEETVEHHPPFTVIICLDRSRLGRTDDPDKSVYYEQRFKRFGVTIVYVHTLIDQNSEYAALGSAIERQGNTEMRRKISRDTKRGQLANCEKGNSSGGFPPLGYVRAAIDKITRVFKRVLHPGEHKSIDDKVVWALGNPEDVRAVQEMFQLKKEGVGLGTIGVRYNKAAATIRAILTNRAYLGWRIYNKVSHDSSRSKFIRNDESKVLIVKNAHPAIISQEQFDAVQKTFQTRRPSGTHTHSPYLLAGLIRCEHCGYTFSGVTRTRKNKTKGMYRLGLYECIGRHNRGKTVCPGCCLRQDTLEQLVLRTIIKRIQEADYLKKVEALVQAKLQQGNGHESEIDDLRRRLVTNQKALKNVMLLIERGADLPEVQSSLDRLTLERRHLEREIAEAQARHHSSDDVKQLLQSIKKLTKNFETTFAKAPIHLQKSLIRRFVDRISVDPATKEITLRMKQVPTVDSALTMKDTETVRIRRRSLVPSDPKLIADSWR